MTHPYCKDCGKATSELTDDRCSDCHAAHVKRQPAKAKAQLGQTMTIDEQMADAMQRLFSERELQTLVMALAHSRGERGFTDEEAATLIGRARELRLKATMLQLVIKKRLHLDLDSDGELVFVHPHPNGETP